MNRMNERLSEQETAMQEANEQMQNFMNFREMIARMLGLDPVAMIIPDYQIISRLERLIQKNGLEQSNNAPYHANENPFLKLSIKTSKISPLPNMRKSKLGKHRGWKTWRAIGLVLKQKK